MEEWRDVPGFRGYYKININTKEGKCNSYHNGKHGYGKPHLLSNKIRNGKDRVFWNLTLDGKQYLQQAARWIALTYPELVTNEYFEGAIIDHIDGDPTNNSPENLRWTDHKGNSNNPVSKTKMSNSQKGRVITDETRKILSEKIKDNTGKWVVQLSLDNEILHFYRSSLQAERKTGVHQSGISLCCLGKQKTAGGYLWKYA